jgi:hypothetical protein
MGRWVAEDGVERLVGDPVGAVGRDDAALDAVRVE